MPKLKDPSQKKIQLTTRMRPETLERMKKFYKFHRNVGPFLDYAMDEYDRLNEENEDDITLSEKLTPEYLEKIKDKDFRKREKELLQKEIEEIRNHRFYEIGHEKLLEREKNKVELLEYIREYEDYILLENIIELSGESLELMSKRIERYKKQLDLDSENVKRELKQEMNFLKEKEDKLQTINDIGKYLIETSEIKNKMID